MNKKTQATKSKTAPFIKPAPSLRQPLDISQSKEFAITVRQRSDKKSKVCRQPKWAVHCSSADNSGPTPCFRMNSVAAVQILTAKGFSVTPGSSDFVS